MSIVYLTGDATNPIGDGVKIIAHVCNDKLLWGKGFVLALSARWKMPEWAYRNWTQKEKSLTLGSVQLVGVEPDLWVANMVGQHDVVAHGDIPPVRYDAIRTALQFVAQDAKHLKASIHMPYIGCGLAGGDWKIVKKIVEETLENIPVFVYQYTDTKSRSFVPTNGD